VRTSVHKDNGELDASYSSWLALAGSPLREFMAPLHSANSVPSSEETASKGEHINLRIAAPDKRAIEAKAKRAGLSVADYMRRTALGKTIVERVPPELRKQLVAAGNNFQQLARLANSGKLPGAGIEALNELVNRLLQTLR
jgi:uncharacterized protein (DUF1778 family)